MRFQEVLQEITHFLTEEGWPYAVIGGFALHAYGLHRATYDLDLVTEAEAQPGLVEYLESLGYETLHRSAGYSNHAHSETGMGRIDLVYVRGRTREKLFADVQEREILPGFRAPVPRPEHLAAMKVQAMKNDPERRLQDLADIRYLLRLPGVDRREIEGYLERQGLREKLDEL